MHSNIEVLDINTLYEAELQHIQHLTNGQEIWLGIAIDSAKLIRASVDIKAHVKKENLEYLYIGLFNKIRSLFEQLRSFDEYFQNNSTSYQEVINLIIYEALEFKNSTEPVEQSIITNLLGYFPEKANQLLFDFACSLWLLPYALMDYYYKELRNHHNPPKISDLLDIYNPLEGLEEVKNIFNHAAKAREWLIKSNLSYVKWFAFKYRKFGLDYEDVIQEGNIGLIKAVNRFDVRRNVRLKTLAVWWIKQSITRAIADSSRIIRLPVHLNDTYQSLKNEQRTYNYSHSEEPSISTLAELSGLDAKRVIELIQWAKPPLPLEKMKICEESLVRYTASKNYYWTPSCQDCEKLKSIQSDQNQSLIVDFEIPICLDQSLIIPSYENSDYTNLLLGIFPDYEAEDQLDRIFNKKINQIVAVALGQLRPRERRILDYRYGFKNGDTHTLQEVADKFGVTRERIRQIESDAFDKLRQTLWKDPTIREYNGLE